MRENTYNEKEINEIFEFRDDEGNGILNVAEYRLLRAIRYEEVILKAHERFIAETTWV